MQCVTPTSCFPPWKPSDQLRAHTHIHTHGHAEGESKGEGEREREREVEHHTQRGNPISWKSSNITTLSSLKLLHYTDEGFLSFLRSSPVSDRGFLLLQRHPYSFIPPRLFAVFFSFFLREEGGTKLARGEHGVFHGTSSEGAVLATFQENGERSDWRSL